MEVKEAIISRRSNRRFAGKEIEKEKVETLIEAARYAPSGGNSQTNHFFVISDKNVLEELRLKVMAAFSKMEITEGMYRSLASSIYQSKTGNYYFHYNAPLLIVIANKKDYGNNMADAACALENILIMANELDLGTCYINQLKWLNEEPQIVEVFERNGLKEDEKIMCAVAVGYVNSEDGLPVRTPLPRTGNEVTYI